LIESGKNRFDRKRDEFQTRRDFGRLVPNCPTQRCDRDNRNCFYYSLV
jgi:hypothetical protein